MVLLIEKFGTTFIIFGTAINYDVITKLVVGLPWPGGVQGFFVGFRGWGQSIHIIKSHTGGAWWSLGVTD